MEEVRGKTAYLDGIKGFAAFMIYWTHHELWAYDELADISITPRFEDGFSHNGHSVFVALPFVRIMFSAGHYVVEMIFVNSGFALSLKPPALIHAGGDLEFLASVSGALFRRALRLLIPLDAMTYIYVISLWIFDINALPTRLKTFSIEIAQLPPDVVELTAVFPNLKQGSSCTTVLPGPFQSSFETHPSCGRKLKAVESVEPQPPCSLRPSKCRTIYSQR